MAAMADVSDGRPSDRRAKIELDARADVELFGATACPYTSEVREHLLWNRIAFIEYDVETDIAARARLLALTGRVSVPVVVERGQVKEIGWRGRTCAIAAS
jgi:glutaredoxin 3